MADNISGLYAAQDFYIKAIDMMMDQMLSSQSNRDVRVVANMFKEWSNMGRKITSYQQRILKMILDRKNCRGDSLPLHTII